MEPHERRTDSASPTTCGGGRARQPSPMGRRRPGQERPHEVGAAGTRLSAARCSARFPWNSAKCWMLPQGVALLGRPCRTYSQPARALVG